MLPYATIAEAEAALGRPFTSVETLWFHWTATVPDSWLFFLNIVFLFMIFNMVPLPTLFLELYRPSYFLRFKLQPSVFLPPSSIAHCYKTVMITFFMVVTPMQLLAFPAIEIIGVRSSLPLPSAWEIISQITVYFLIEDYGNYWIHRWLHTEWGYNNIHYMHHLFSAPMSFAAPYAHWAEVILLGIPSFVGPALVPGHMITLWLWIGLRQMEAIETHSGYDFPWIPTKLIPFYGGSEYHDYHHYVGEKSQSNFASVFTYCDYIYGTDKGYRYRKDMLAKMKKEHTSEVEKYD